MVHYKQPQILTPDVQTPSRALPVEETSNQERLAQVVPPRTEPAVEPEGPWLDDPELGVDDFLVGLRGPDRYDTVGGLLASLPDPMW